MTRRHHNSRRARLKSADIGRWLLQLLARTIASLVVAVVDALLRTPR